MNIRFPKAHDVKTALSKIRVAFPVPLGVHFLDGCQVFVFRRISMPKVSVPLDNDRGIRYEHIHNELPADDNLFFKRNTHRAEYVGSGDFECGSSRREFSGYLAFKRALVPTFVRAVVERPQVGRRARKTLATHRTFQGHADSAAHPRAITTATFIKQPAGCIERLLAGLATHYLTATTFRYRSLSGGFFGFLRLLPLIRTGEATKSDTAVSPGFESGSTPFAFVGAAVIAPLCEIGARRKRRSASLTYFELRNIPHNPIIPWLVAERGVACAS